MKRHEPKPVFKPRILELSGGKFTQWKLGKEISAGVAVSLIALPLSLALGVASIPHGADTPLSGPALGLITAIIGGFLVSLLSGSRVQIGGPTAAFIPIVLLVIIQHGYSGLLLATFMAGCILVLMGLFRFGALIRYIPWPVTSGFTTGIAIAIVLTQIPDALGYAASSERPHDFTAKIAWLVGQLPTLNPITLAVFLLSLLIILLWPRLKFQHLPGTVVAVVLVTALAWLLDLDQRFSLETIGSRFGADSLPRSLPMPTAEFISWSRVRELIAPATAIAILGAIESLLSAVVADGLSGDRHDSNTELVAQGITNMICPFFGGLPVTGAIARTSANISNGACTPLAGMAVAISLLLTLMLAAPLANTIPLACIAAVLVSVAVRMGEWNELLRARKMPPSDALVLFTTCSLTVIFDLVIAVEVGMVLAAILFIKRVAETTEVHKITALDALIREENIAYGRDLPDDVLLYRIFGPFLFGAAEKLEDALARIERLPTVLILDLHLVTAMDATGLNVLESIAERMRKSGRHVILSGIHRQPLGMLRKAGSIQLLGRRNFCASLQDSIERAKQLIG